MRRRLVKQGNGGLTLTLPIEWLRKRNLKQGDEVTIAEHESVLVIGGKGASSQSSAITLNEPHPALTRTIVSGMYRMGYDAVQIKGSGTNHRPTLNRLSSEFIGCECISDDSEYLVMKNVLLEIETSKSILIRLWKKTIQLFEEKKLSQKERDEVWKSSIRLRDYCQRTCIIERTPTSYELYSLAAYLEKLSYLAKAKSSNHSRPLADWLRNMHAAFQNNNTVLARSIYRQIHLERKEFQRKNIPSSHSLEISFAIASKVVFLTAYQVNIENIY